MKMAKKKTEKTTETTETTETTKTRKPRDPEKCAKRLAIISTGGDLEIVDLGTRKDANEWVNENIEGGTLECKAGVNTMVSGEQCVLVTGKIPVPKIRTTAAI